MPEMMSDWLEVFETEQARRPKIICQECKGRGWIAHGTKDPDVIDVDRCPICGGCGTIYEETHAQA